MYLDKVISDVGDIVIGLAPRFYVGYGEQIRINLEEVA